MDKFLKILSAQNPTYETFCENPQCKNKIIIKTQTLFSSGDTFIFKCPKCNFENKITGIDAWVNKMKNEFKKNGFSW